jgi:hypothetical protein
VGGWGHSGVGLRPRMGSRGRGGVVVSAAWVLGGVVVRWGLVGAWAFGVGRAVVVSAAWAFEGSWWGGAASARGQ